MQGATKAKEIKLNERSIGLSCFRPAQESGSTAVWVDTGMSDTQVRESDICKMKKSAQATGCH